MSAVTTWSVSRSVAPANLPVTVAEAKRKLRLTVSDTTHDSELLRHIESATEIFERDTDTAVISQTFLHYEDQFPTTGKELHLSQRPVQSITSVKYQDDDDVQQTLATTEYVFDPRRRTIRLAVDKTWPSITSQKDAIEVTYVAGFGTGPENVMRMVQEGILCKVAELFYGNSPEAMKYMQAYDSIVGSMMRPNYP